MKKLLKSAVYLLAFSTSIALFSSCEKEEDEGKLPTISFKTESGYTATDTKVAKSTQVKMGIKAAKAEEKDPLKVFTITRSLNDGADSVVYTENLSGTNGDSYNKDYTATTNSQAGKEKYTFTIVNKDGLVNKASLTLTVE